MYFWDLAVLYVERYVYIYYVYYHYYYYSMFIYSLSYYRTKFVIIVIEPKA